MVRLQAFVLAIVKAALEVAHTSRPPGPIPLQWGCKAHSRTNRIPLNASSSSLRQWLRWGNATDSIAQQHSPYCSVSGFPVPTSCTLLSKVLVCKLRGLIPPSLGPVQTNFFARPPPGRNCATSAYIILSDHMCLPLSDKCDRLCGWGNRPIAGDRTRRLFSYIRSIVRSRLYTPSTMAPSSARTKGELNPRSTSYEFGGPLGAAAIILIVPIVVYSLYFGCSDRHHCPSPFASVKELDMSTVVNPSFWESLWDTNAMLVYLVWYTFCVVSWAALPGDWVQGLPMRNGQRMKYKTNGRYSLIPRGRREN